VKNLLSEAGFEELSEGDKWELKPGSKYYVARNNSTIGAFIVGKGLSEGAPTHFKVIGTHSDSPRLTLAPVTKTSAAGYE